jgi:hypothetical protein
VPLQGTDQAVVPYFPLQTQASSDFSDATGYVFNGTNNQQQATITVNKRKYQPVDYSSYTYRRVPAFNPGEIGRLNFEKLGVDIVNDVLSCVTPGNFPTLAPYTVAPNAIVSDDIETLRGLCNAASWPSMGRGLILDSTVEAVLHKDPAYKLALNIGGTEVIREGRLPNVGGFDLAWMPNLPTNGAKVIGAAVFKSAILAAFCPIDPTPEVKAQLSAYEIVTDEESGVTANYRSWGLAQTDRTYEVVEAAYGYQPGVPVALLPIVSP